MEVTGFEEANATAFAQVAQEVDFLVGKEGTSAVMKCLQILDELPLALVQRRRADLNNVLVEVQQWLIQVPAKPDGFHAAERPRFEVTLLNEGLEVFELGNNLLLRSLDQDTVVAIARLLLHAQEVRIVRGQLLILQVRQLPLTLAEGVVALGVLFEQRQRNLFPQPYLLERVERQFLGGDQQLVPALIDKECLNAFPRQVQVVPAALSLKPLQLEV